MEDRDQAGARLYSPSAARNQAPIAAVLSDVLAENARVLEIGSGTGEHAVAACKARPDIRWQPSDLDEASRVSQAAWASECPGRIAAPVAIDLTEDGWAEAFDTVDALVCINVIHIAPWRAAEGLADGAGRLVTGTGCVVLYGPYQEGRQTAPSNLEFDRNLQARNPSWGVRALSDVVGLFERAGFALAERRDMPANNLALVFRRQETFDASS